MREGEARVILPSRGGSGVIHIPANVVKDSTFPFQTSEKIYVRISEQKLTVEGGSG